MEDALKTGTVETARQADASAEAKETDKRDNGYFQTVTALIRNPSRFFSGIEVTGLKAPFRVLLISAAFHAAVSFTYVYGRSVPLTMALLANSLALPFAMAGLAWMLQIMVMGREASFTKSFAAFAYASSATLIFSWVPAMGILTEPWRLGIAAAGFAKGAGLGWKRGIILTVLSVLLFLMLLWSALPLLMKLKELLA